jgi:hypothetical protein
MMNFLCMMEVPPFIKEKRRALMLLIVPDHPHWLILSSFPHIEPNNANFVVNAYAWRGDVGWKVRIRPVVTRRTRMFFATLDPAPNGFSCSVEGLRLLHIDGEDADANFER